MHRARNARCEWLHVDFSQEHRGFHPDACGFSGADDAGLIRLHNLADLEKNDTP